MKTNNTKQRLFEVMEMLNPEMDNSWAVFRISHGKKCFATSVENGNIHICDYAKKYSDPEVLKFSLEQAKKIVIDNYSFYNALGIVNNKGVQLGLGKYDRVWQRI
jgi:hypothetical protein